MNKLALSALTLSLALSSCTMMQKTGSLGVQADPTLGQFLTAQNGMTLYLHTKDTAGVSTCYNQCAVNWPPLLATTLPKLPAGATGTLTLTPRTDGTQQVTYNNMPLYYWIKDAKVGDTTGQNVGGVWFVVKP